LGLSYASKHPENVRAIAFMEELFFIYDNPKQMRQEIQLVRNQVGE